MAMKYCDKHGIWYDYAEGCPECEKVPNAIGTILGTIFGAIFGGVVLLIKVVINCFKENNEQQKELRQQKHIETAIKVSAEILDIQQEHNIIIDSSLGMNIHVKFEIDNMLDKDCECAAYFYDDKKRVLKDTNQRYHSADGVVSVGTHIKPNYTNCIYNDLVLFIPYSELHLSEGFHNLSFVVIIFDDNSTVISKSNYYNFNINWNSRIVKNRKMPSEYAKYADIISIIEIVKQNHCGFAVVSIEDYYVQFYVDGDTLFMEAVSNCYNSNVGDKDKEFRRIGFTIDRRYKDNYHNSYDKDDVQSVLKDMVMIFEFIYGVPFESYRVENNCG